MLNLQIQRFSQGLEAAERLIRDGRFAPARAELAAISRQTQKLPRAHLVRVASLFRRAGAPMKGLTILRPLVRPASSRHESKHATPQELTEYAALLQRVGADNEALRLLESIDPLASPQVLLFQAFGHFRKWDYARAVPLLERYIAMNGITDYERMIGEVNLAVALVEADRHEALAVLSLIKEKTRESGALLLYGNVLETEAEFFIKKHDRSAALASIREARELLEGNQTVDSLAVEKLARVLEGNAKALKRVRDDLGLLGAWENARDCDYQRAVLTGDARLFRRLYFGTPHAKYRERLLRHCSLDKTLAYTVLLGPRGEARQRFDSTDPEPILSPGQLPHRLLLVLLSDFYRPLRTTELFDKLFPGQFFDPATSPALVHQAMRRLRLAFAERSSPLIIEEKGGGFRLTSQVPVAIRVQVHESFASDDVQSEWVIRQLVKRLGSQRKGRETFTRADAEDALGLTPRKLQRLIGKMVSRDLLRVIGRGPQTAYQFNSQQK